MKNISMLLYVRPQLYCELF